MSNNCHKQDELAVFRWFPDTVVDFSIGRSVGYKWRGPNYENTQPEKKAGNKFVYVCAKLSESVLYTHANMGIWKYLQEF